MLIRLIYSSNFSDDLTWTNILEIVNTAKVANEKSSVTGILITCEQEILQVLEGEPENVTQIFSKIEKDPRHKNIQLISALQIENRQFDVWKMKEVNVDRLIRAQFGWMKRLLVRCESIDKGERFSFPTEYLSVYNLLRVVYVITLDN